MRQHAGSNVYNDEHAVTETTLTNLLFQKFRQKFTGTDYKRMWVAFYFYTHKTAYAVRALQN